MTSHHSDNHHSPAKPQVKETKGGELNPHYQSAFRLGTPIDPTFWTTGEQQTDPISQNKRPKCKSPGIILSQAPTNGGSKKKGLSNSLFKIMASFRLLMQCTKTLGYNGFSDTFFFLCFNQGYNNTIQLQTCQFHAFVPSALLCSFSKWSTRHDMFYIMPQGPKFKKLRIATTSLSLSSNRIN